MSDTVADSQHSTVPASRKRSVSPIVWLVVLLVAAGAFGAAVVYAGGINEVLNLVGLGPTAGPEQPGGAPVSVASTATTSTGEASPVENVLPASAETAMYREQIQSQENIALLLNGEVESLTLGTPKESSDSASVPVKVKFKDGSSLSGSMKLKKYDGLWYFFSLTASGHEAVTTEPDDVDRDVISVITQQQASAENQDMLENGILGGGFTTARVAGVTDGSGTATVNLVLSGGSEPEQEGQFLCIEKKDGSSTYWFLTKFSAE